MKFEKTSYEEIHNLTTFSKNAQYKNILIFFISQDAIKFVLSYLVFVKMQFKISTFKAYVLFGPIEKYI